MTRPLFPWLAFGIIGSMTGCGEPQSGGQIGGETTGCVVVAASELDRTDPSPLGFSAADVLALVGGAQSVSLAWEKGGTADLTTSLEYSGGAVRYLDREWKDDGSGAEIGSDDCGDAVEIASTLGFTTSDGAFAESWPVHALGLAPDMASIATPIDVNALRGSYEITEIDPSSFDEVMVYLDLELTTAAARGEMTGQAARCEASLDGSCMAEGFGIATFPAR
jgi:hypothetical protein